VERIAIISDIHGNVPALRSVLDDIKLRNISRIFCLGDLIGKGPSSDITVDLVQTTCELVIKGNWEDYITKVSDQNTVIWHQNKLGKQRLEYLSNLPFSIEFYMSGRFIRLFHASPRSIYERIQPWDSFEQRLSLFESSEYCQQKLQADVIGYGDIHNAYVQNFSGKTLINVGSVGNPLEITQASYAIIEGQYHSKEPSAFSIQLIRVPYDIELSVKQAIDDDMPSLEAYIHELRTARYRGNKN